MCLLERFWQDQRGYEMAELLVIIAAVTAIASIVAGILSPELRDVYQRAVGSVIDIMGSGY